MAWAREFEAKEVIEVLRRYGAFAEAEWHGEKPELKEHEEVFDDDAEWAEEEEGEYNEEEVVDGQPSNSTKPERFEIEVDETKDKKLSGTFHGDALQRQRAPPRPVY